MTNEALKQVPGYEEARRRESLSRAVAVVAPQLPLCGFWVRPLTPRICAELELAGNAFIVGGAARHVDCVDFLWRSSVHFVRPGGGWRTWGNLLERLRIVRAVERRPLSKTVAEIGAYIDMARQDGNNLSWSKEGSIDNRKEAAHWTVAHWASTMRVAPSMTLDQYLDTPLALLDQIYRISLVMNGRGADIYNESERILTRYISSLTTRRND